MTRLIATMALAALLAACGGGDGPFDETRPELHVTIDPPVLVARHGESVTLRIDVPDVPDADLPNGYAFDLDEVVGKIEVTTAPCHADAGGSRACQDWTITPRAGSVPGRYDISVRTSGSRAGTGHGSFELTVVAAPSPAFGAAVAVAASDTHVLVRNDAGRVFALGYNDHAQTRAGYRRLPVPGIDFERDYGVQVVEPGTVGEFVEAPLPEGRWLGIDAVWPRSYAVRDDGTVWAWGNNTHGAFGFPPLGDVTIELSPRQVPGLADVRALSVGDGARTPSYALLADGSVRFWQADILSPRAVCEEYTNDRPRECRRTFAGVRALARSARSAWSVSPDWPDGTGFDFFLKDDGSVWDPGPNRPGRLDGIAGPVRSIALDADSNLFAAGTDGSLWLRGPTRRDPVRVEGIGDVVAVSARPGGDGDVFALRSDGTVWSWIHDRPAPQGTPQPIAGLANVVALGAHYAITGDCIAGGALWRIDRRGTAQEPKAVRVPGFGDGPGCTPPPTVEVAITARGQGRVVSAPGGIDCGSSCVARFARQGELRLHAAPAMGWKFDGWLEGGCSDAVVPTADLACTAVFVEDAERRLSVRIDGEGSVTSEPAGIACRDDCAEAYDADTTVTLTAVPAAGHGFERFVGDDDCADGTLTMDRVKHCVALFEPLAAPPAPIGFSATVVGTAVQLRWDAGGNVVERYSLERADASGVFVAIAGTTRGVDIGLLDITTAPSTAYKYRLVAINSRGASPPVTASATTGAAPLPVLDVSISGTGSGSVISEPGDIACGSACSEAFAPGTTVTLHADGNFARWEGCDSASGNRCVVTMDRSRRVLAIFDASAAPRWLLSVVKQRTGAVVSTPSGIECGFVCTADFADGTVVTLSGSAQFAGANGCDTIVGLQCTVTMNRSRFVAFGGTGAQPPQRFTLTVSVDRAGGVVGTTDGEIGCGGGSNRCSASYAAGTGVGVYAAPLPDASVRLEAWQGDCASFGAQSQITLTMDRDWSCRAVFVSGR